MPDGQKICFVVQGFGEKTDLTNGRKLNLDASYQVIKEAVEDAGLKCLRADEIVHSGTIDEPMYQWLYRADLVIADLSTYNVNAAYELGVRYGVRRHATIIVAEDQFKNPFDVSHIVIRPYKHLGDDIGVQEARRFKRELAGAIKQILAEEKTDSPFYTFVPLSPPSDRAAVLHGSALTAPLASEDDPALEGNAKQLLDQARVAIARDDFGLAKALFQAVHTMRPRDEYVVQQLALATYKDKQADPMTALKEAHALLQTLDPATTNNPETLGLWGAVHKRLWDATGELPNLDAAIGAHERGFYLKQDYYNGINLAFLLNVRAERATQAGDTAEAIADFVLARRVRRDVVRICEALLAAPPAKESMSLPGAKDPAEEKYWIVATLWEAAVGVEDAPAAERWRKAAEATATAGWMVESTRRQLTRLEQLLASSPLRGLGPAKPDAG